MKQIRISWSSGALLSIENEPESILNAGQAGVKGGKKQPPLLSTTPCPPRQVVSASFICHSITDLDPQATVISTDGTGAYDMISRNAMLEELLRMEERRADPPFHEMFVWDSINILVG